MPLEGCHKDHELCSVELGERIILDPPRGFNERLKRLGGLTPNGKPYFRLVWGWSRLDWIGGIEWDVLKNRDDEIIVDRNGRPWTEIIIQPLTRAPKYWPDFNRWILEMWWPPEAYGTPRTWKEHTQMVPDYAGCGVRGPRLAPGTVIECRGPYPAEGDYECAMVFNGIRREHLPMHALEMALDFVQAGRAMTQKQRFAAKQYAFNAERAQARKEYDEKVDELWDGIYPAFGGKPHTKYSYNAGAEVN